MQPWRSNISRVEQTKWQRELEIFQPAAFANLLAEENNQELVEAVYRMLDKEGTKGAKLAVDVMQTLLEWRRFHLLNGITELVVYKPVLWVARQHSKSQ